jgi:glycosyltransferase involved in cell wall biosynthesis
VDAIVASMSPYTSADAAAELARELDKPWIAGLRDPWALDEMTIYPSRVHRRSELERMRRRLGTAAAIVTTTPEASRRIRATFPELADRPIVSIPNGFDPADFAAPPPPRDGSAFRIVHTGYLHTDLGRQQLSQPLLRRLLGGGTEGVNILSRSHVYLLQAVERLVARHPSLGSRIEILLAGVLSASDREVAERSPFVRTLGYLSHPDTIRLMRSADLLFLPMQNLPPGRRSATVPGKTYEYLASQRPILAAVPEGDARDLLLQAGTAHVCVPDDVEAMVKAIEVELERSGTDSPQPQVPHTMLEKFERVALAAEYAAVIDAVVGSEARRSRAVRTPSR